MNLPGINWPFEAAINLERNKGLLGVYNHKPLIDSSKNAAISSVSEESRDVANMNSPVNWENVLLDVEKTIISIGC